MMSATPIPQTLALTVFGDLDISTIKTMPKGRLPIKTHLTKPGNESHVYETVRKELQNGNQAYFVYPMIERWDDNLAVIKELDYSIAGTSANYNSVEAVANWRVKKLFSDNMSITTIKYDANGNMTSEHTNWVAKATGSAAPGTPSANSPRCYYQFSSTTPGSVMTVYHIVDAAEAKALAKTPDEINGSPAAYTYFKEKQTFVMSQEVEGSETYVWKATDEWNNTWSLKWYNDDSQFLPGIDGDDFDLTTMSAGELLYKFIPVVFENMAPVVLNGSVKKVLADFLGASFSYVGQGGPEADEAVMALADSANSFFIQGATTIVFSILIPYSPTIYTAGSFERTIPRARETLFSSILML